MFFLAFNSSLEQNHDNPSSTITIQKPKDRKYEIPTNRSRDLEFYKTVSGKYNRNNFTKSETPKHRKIKISTKLKSRNIKISRI